MQENILENEFEDEYEFIEVSQSIKEITDEKIKNNEKVVFIDKIFFKRTVFCAQGRLIGYDDDAKFMVKFTNQTGDISINFNHIDVKDGQFKISINLISAYENAPVATGNYSLEFHEILSPDFFELVSTSSDDVSVTLSTEGNKSFAVCYDQENYYIKTELLSTYEKAYVSPDYEIDYNFYKDNDVHWKLQRSAMNYFRAFSSYNVDSCLFDLRIGYKAPNNMPVPYWEKKRNEKRKKKALKQRDVSLYGNRIIFNFFLRFARRKGNVILFSSGSRAKIGGNEEFVYKRMIERGMKKTHKFLFDFKPTITEKMPFFKKISFLYKLAVADIIIIDDYYPDIYTLDFPEYKKVVQVWHACGAFKAVGLERLGKPGAPAFNTRVHKCYTHVPVSSYHSALHHAECFGLDEKCFYPTGVPRTDIFFDPEYKKNIMAQLAQEFPMSVGKSKVYLYAPTFRGNGANSAHFPYEKIDLEAWGEFCIETNSLFVIKMHPFVKQLIRIPEKYQDYIIDATSYREVNDILFMIDVLITDYSSIIYEFSLLKRPMLFYAFDKEEYVATRDFYEEFEKIVPGKIVGTSQELLESVKNEDFEFEKMDYFIKKNFTHTDGKSTDRFIDHIILDEAYDLDIDYSTIF